MKKLIGSLLVAIMVISLTAFSSNNGPTQKGISSNENTSSDETTVDNTATIANGFTLEGKNIVLKSSANADFAETYPNLESVYKKATNVVVGTVEEIRYTDEDAIPRTIYSLLVSETLKGGIEPNSKISVSESNGYVKMKTFIDVYGDAHFPDITQDEIENGVLLQSLGNAPLPETGDEYVIFLGEQKQEGRIAGAYAVIGNFMGKYVLDKSTDLYSRFCPSEDSELYTVESPKTRAITKEQPMSLITIKEKLAPLTQ